MSLPRRIHWRLLCVFLTSIVLVRSTAWGHEFEDGHVERSVAVIIRGDQGRIEYSIGLNPTTRQQLMQFWSDSTPARRSTFKDTDTAERAQLKIPAIGEIPNVVEFPNVGVLTALSERQSHFLELSATNVFNRLKVTVGGTTVPLTLISSQASPRHHVDVTVTLAFQLPLAANQLPAELTIDDGNFRAPQTVSSDASIRSPVDRQSVLQPPPAPFSGGFRYACKSMGGTMLTRSNVASILIRSLRRLDNELTANQIADAFKIRAELIMVE